MTLRAGRRHHGAIASGAVAALAIASLAVHGFPPLTEDVQWHQLWASQVAGGTKPEFEAGSTPHPLVLLLSLLSTVTATDAQADAVMTAIATVMHALSAMLAMMLVRWSTTSTTAGVLTGCLVVSRPFVVATASVGYFDVMYAALLLGAVYTYLVPRRVGATLALLLLAGLVRPDAWLLGVVVVVHQWRTGGRRINRARAGQALVVLTAPLLWTLMDVVVTGRIGHSFFYTRDLAEGLGRPRGPVDALVLGPLRLAQSINVEVAALCVAGIILTTVLGLWTRRDRRLLAALAATVVTTLLANALGTSILQRYMIPGGLLLIVCGAVAGTRVSFDRRSLRVGIVAMVTFAVVARGSEIVHEGASTTAARKQARAVEAQARALPQTCSSVVVSRPAEVVRVARAARIDVASIIVRRRSGPPTVECGT